MIRKRPCNMKPDDLYLVLNCAQKEHDDGRSLFFSQTGRSKTRFSMWNLKSCKLRHNFLLVKLIKALKDLVQYVSAFAKDSTASWSLSDEIGYLSENRCLNPATVWMDLVASSGLGMNECSSRSVNILHIYGFRERRKPRKLLSILINLAPHI